MLPEVFETSGITIAGNVLPAATGTRFDAQLAGFSQAVPEQPVHIFVKVLVD